MIIFKKALDITSYLNTNEASGKTIGFVPTMGALHRGHVSLIDTAKKDSAITVCSIFVNPRQFNDAKDFTNYPSTIEKDIDELEKAGCDVLFMPSVSEIYPYCSNEGESYNLGYLETVLEGKYRPGHFQGVCQVMHRLLSIIPANHLYLGQKDYQQCMVIKKLIELEKIETSVIICLTLRESNGLAMSSRNMRLTADEKKKAVKIFETLSYLKNNIKPGDLVTLKQLAVKNLTDAGFKVDYVEIADANDLQIIHHWNGHSKIVAVAAAFLGQVRLIDNMLLI